MCLQKSAYMPLFEIFTQPITIITRGAPNHCLRINASLWSLLYVQVPVNCYYLVSVGEKNIVGPHGVTDPHMAELTYVPRSKSLLFSFFWQRIAYIIKTYFAIFIFCAIVFLPAHRSPTAMERVTTLTRYRNIFKTAWLEFFSCICLQGILFTILTCLLLTILDMRSEQVNI